MGDIPERELHHEADCTPEADPGRPVAANNRAGTSIDSTYRRFVSRNATLRLLGQTALDRDFARDIDSAAGETIDSL
jgi:hypothetical protein